MHRYALSKHHEKFILSKASRKVIIGPVAGGRTFACLAASARHGRVGYLGKSVASDLEAEAERYGMPVEIDYSGGFPVLLADDGISFNWEGIEERTVIAACNYSQAGCYLTNKMFEIHYLPPVGKGAPENHLPDGYYKQLLMLRPDLSFDIELYR